MIMDRQTLVAIVGAIVAMVLISGSFFGASRSSDIERPTYQTSDIRFSFQQAEAKERVKHPKKQNKPGKEQFVTDGRTSTGSGGSSSYDESDSEVSEDSSDDDSAEGASAEEPPIE